MPYCPQCGTANREGSRFCNFCGASLSDGDLTTCPECNTVNPTTNKFCSVCGAKLATEIKESGAQVTPAPVKDSEPEFPDLEALQDELPTFEAEIPNELLFEVLSLSKDDAYIPEIENLKTKPEPEPEGHLEGATEQSLFEQLENPPLATDGSDDTASPAPEVSVLPQADLEVEQPEVVETEGSLLPEWLDSPEPEEIETTTTYVSVPSEQPAEPVEIAEQAPLPTWLDLKDEEEPAEQSRSLDKSASEQIFSQELALADSLKINEPPPSEEPEVKDLPGWLDLEDHQEPIEASVVPKGKDGWIEKDNIPEWLLLKTSAEPDTEPSRVQEGELLPQWLEIDEEPAVNEEQQPREDLPQIDLERVGLADGEQDTSLADETLEADSDQSPLALDEIAGKPFTPTVNPELERLQKRSAALLSENGLTDETGESIVSPDQQISISKTFQNQQSGDESPFAPPESALTLDLSEEDSTEQTSPQQDQKRTGNQWPRIISLILLIAATAPFFFPLGLVASAGSNTTSAYEAINQVPSGSTVLISFDWDGTNNDEMTPIAMAILNHLASRNVKIIAVSLTPEGSQISQQILSRPEYSGYKYGTDFVNLGFVAGEKAGIQSMVRGFSTAFQKDYLGTNLNAITLTKQVVSIRDTNMVISLAGNPELMQDWVTQLSSVLPNQRIVGGMTALGAPAVQPFVQSKQLLGLVAGLPGATEYERQSGMPGLGTATVDAQSLASLALVVLVIGANVATLIRRTR